MKLDGMHTISIHQPNREEEGDDVEEQPESNLDKPAAVLEVLIPLVALVLHSQHA